MNLSPLPLIEGSLFVDNSMLELLTTCPRSLYYNRFLQRIAAINKPSLSFGSAIHLVLEHRYKSYKNMMPDALLEGEQADILTKHFESQPVDSNDYRNLNWAIEINRRYNQRYDVEPFNLLVNDAGEVMVELSFALPLFTYAGNFFLKQKEDIQDWMKPILSGLWTQTINGFYFEYRVPVIYTGRIDLPVSWDGQIFIGDHKTTSQIGPSFWDKMKMSAQQKGYSWAYEQLTGQKVEGYFINAIRVKEPPLSLGKDGGRTKKNEADWWNESFQRERYLLQPGELEEWKFNTIALIKTMFYHYQEGYMPQKTVWCDVETPAAETGFPMGAGQSCVRYGRCQYYDVCSLPASDRNLMLTSGVFTDNTWSPLKQNNTSKTINIWD